MNRKILLGIIIFLLLFIISELLYIFLLNPKNLQSTQPSQIPEVKKGSPDQVKTEFEKLPSPDPSASNQEKIKFEQTILRKAHESGSVFISTDCTITPAVIKAIDPSTIQIVNEDTIKHSLHIDEGKIIEIKANGSATYTLTSYPQNKLLTIFCDGKSTASAYLTIPSSIR